MKRRKMNYNYNREADSRKHLPKKLFVFMLLLALKKKHC